MSKKRSKNMDAVSPSTPSSSFFGNEKKNESADNSSLDYSLPSSFLLSKRQIFFLRCLPVLGGFLLNFVYGSIYTFANLSTYVISYMRVYGGDENVRYQHSTSIYTIAITSLGVTMFFSTYIQNYFGLKKCMYLSSIIFSLSIYLSSYSVCTYALFACTYGLIFGMCDGISLPCLLSTVYKYWPHHKGFVGGIALAGMGISASILGPIQTWIINPSNKQPTYSPYEENINEKYYVDVDVLNRVPLLFFYMSIFFSLLTFVGTFALTFPSKILNNFIFDFYYSRHNTGHPGDYRILPFHANENRNSRSVEVIYVSNRNSNTNNSNNNNTYDNNNNNNTSININNIPHPHNNKIQTTKTHTREEEEEEEAEEEENEEEEEIEKVNYSPSQIIRMKEFYLLFFLFIFCCQYVNMMATLWKIIGITHMKLSDEHLSFYGNLFNAFSNTFGRLFWGKFSDYFGCRYTFLTLNTVACVSLFLFESISLHMGSSFFLVWTSALFFCVGGVFVCMTTATSVAFGTKYFSSNYGVLFTGRILSTLLTSYLTSMYFNVLGTINFVKLIAVCTSISAALSYFLSDFLFSNQMKKYKQLYN